MNSMMHKMVENVVIDDDCSGSFALSRYLSMAQGVVFQIVQISTDLGSRTIGEETQEAPAGKGNAQCLPYQSDNFLFQRLHFSFLIYSFDNNKTKT